MEASCHRRGCEVVKEIIPEQEKEGQKCKLVGGECGVQTQKDSWFYENSVGIVQEN